MRKFFKILRNIFLGLLACIILLVSGAFIYNKVKMKQEEKYWENPPGQMVEVDGHKMHIYSEGEGDHTIVFLSAWGDTSPYNNFLPLCKELSSDAKVVILERFGYGLSDTVDEERTFDKILEEDREGLEKAGIEGPYVLAPHSIAGPEAILWAQKYPSEIEGIVGMDISVPSMREEYAKGKSGVTFMEKLLVDSGLFRLMYGNIMAKYGKPAGEADKMELAIACREMNNKNKVSEDEHLVEALDEIVSMPLPTVPTIQYVSKPNCDMDPKWESGHQDLVDASENGKLIKLDCGHYVYWYEKDRIVNGIKEFIKTL